MEVLLVEDNPGDARLVQEMLKEGAGDFTLHVAERLGSALELLSSSQDVDVVLLDLGLPDSRGLETLSRLRTQFQRVPVVIMTSIDDESLGVRAVHFGAQDYLVKGQTDGRLLRRALSYAIERKKADEALKEKEEFLARLAEMNPAVISVTDLTTNRETYSSRSGLDLLGYKPEQIGDLTAFSASILYPGDFDRIVAAVSEMTKANDNRMREIEVRTKAADGKWRWFQITYVIFKRDDAGRPLQSMNVARDITERKEAEEELRRRTHELEAVNKELEAFSYSVSHDLRAPLRSMDGFAHMLLEDYGDRLDAQGKEYIDRIHSSSQIMAQLIDDMLKLSRIGRAEMKVEDVDLSEMAQSVAEGLKRTQPERKAEVVVQRGVHGVGDKALLRILLQNLLGNAWKYTGRAEEAKIEFGVSRMNGIAVYSVKDNGIGLDMTYANKLFQPFQRLHSERDFSGTGIGLAIVQRIINRHRGRVWAESEVGHGATFFFTLRENGHEASGAS